MKARFLFPYRWKLAGIVLLVLGIAFYLISTHYQLQLIVWHNFRPNEKDSFYYEGKDECFDNEIQLASVLTGLILLSFSKEKVEDEQIAQLRLESLQWAIYFNYIVFFLLIWFSYGSNFLWYVMYNMLTLLVFFFTRFRWKIYQINRSVKLEEQLS
jgi:hypothetical protein